MNVYRMNNEEKKEQAFGNLKKFIDESGRTKFADYLEKNLMFDQRMEAYLKNMS